MVRSQFEPRVKNPGVNFVEKSELGVGSFYEKRKILRGRCRGFS